MVMRFVIFQREIQSFSVAQCSIQNSANCTVVSCLFNYFSYFTIQECKDIFNTLVVTPTLLALSMSVANNFENYDL